MTVHAQNSCTLSHITDVQAVYTYYYLASSDITSNMAPKDNVNAPGASTIRITYNGVNYDWTLTEPTLNIVDDVIQTAVGKLYFMECTLFSDSTYDWGPLMTSSTYAAAKAAYNLSSQALANASAAKAVTDLMGGHFIYGNAIPHTSTSAGARVVEQIEEDDVDLTTTPSKWHHNVNIGANGIQLRYNEAVMAQLAANQSGNNTALKFYKPPSVSGNTTTQGALAMELTSSDLKFYGSSSTADATLSSAGLVLSKGGIQAGPPNQKGFIYLSSEDYLGDITINNHSPLKKYTEVENPEGNPKEKGWYEKNEEVYTLTEDTEVQQGKVYYQDESDPKWRQIIGNKFGVDSEGNLYAASARIGSDVKIGNETKYHISLADNEIAFWSGEESISVNKTAYITGNYMYIPYTVVLNEMRVGQGDNQAGDSAKWSWRYIESTENLRLVWLGGDGE